MSNENQKDFSETQSYSLSSNVNKTSAYQEDSNKTQTYDAKKDGTQAYEIENKGLTDKTTTHNLGVGDKIEVNQKQYEILVIISGDDKTGEAVIYKIKDSSNKIYALKLYFEFKDRRLEPNSEALKRIEKIDDPDILKLYDYGTGANKYENKFCFEVCEFAEGGNLLTITDFKKKYDPDFLKSNVIPEIFKGIKKLHQHKIYHCDLKPQNVFFLDKEQTDLVIGDYGSAKTFEQSSEKELRVTSIVKGTNFYRSPEQSEGIISKENDYYSFGMILLNLLYPHLVNELNYGKIRERRVKNLPIIDYDPRYKIFNQLIAGLTLQDVNNRWGEKEVELWLAGESVEVKYRAEAELAPIKLGHVTIRTENDLVEYIENDKNWYEELIENSTGYSLLLSWLSNLQDLRRSTIFDVMVKYYQQDGKTYVKESILRYFFPERPVIVEIKNYNLFGVENITDLVDKFFKHLDDIWKITDIRQLKFYLFQLEFSLRSLETQAQKNLKLKLRAIIDKISSVLNIKPKDNFEDCQAVFYPKLTDETLLDLFYAFDQNRVFKDLSNSMINSMEGLGFFFARNESLFNDKYLAFEKNKFLKKQKLESISNLTYKEFLFQLFNKHIKSEIELVDIKFDHPDNGKCTTFYNFGKSLTEYFQQNSIANKLTETNQAKESIVLNKSKFTSSEKIFQDLINNIESKHQIMQDSINRESIVKFKFEIKNKKREHFKGKIIQLANEIFKSFKKSISFLFKEGILSFIFIFSILMIFRSQIHQILDYENVMGLQWLPDTEGHGIGELIVVLLIKMPLALIWTLIVIVIAIIVAILQGLNYIFVLPLLISLLVADITRNYHKKD